MSDSLRLYGLCQAPLSMGFPRQEYWSGLPFPSPGDFPDPGTEPESLTSPALAGGFFTTSATIQVCNYWGRKGGENAGRERRRYIERDELDRERERLILNPYSGQISWWANLYPPVYPQDGLWLHSSMNSLCKHNKSQNSFSLRFCPYKEIPQWLQLWK